MTATIITSKQRYALLLMIALLISTLSVQFTVAQWGMMGGGNPMLMGMGGAWGGGWNRPMWGMGNGAGPMMMGGGWGGGPQMMGAGGVGGPWAGGGMLG
uniref:Glycine-rich protein n=1 Tax=Globodera pallida TaxID=36090 RepID=A0A183CHS7_GLOPA